MVGGSSEVVGGSSEVVGGQNMRKLLVTSMKVVGDQHLRKLEGVIESGKGSLKVVKGSKHGKMVGGLRKVVRDK